MGKQIGIVVWFSLNLCITFALGEYYSKTRPFTPKQEVVTHLHFFLHDTLTTPNPSAVMIAKPNPPTGGANNSLPPFGSLYAVDDLLTVGPDPKSKIIGNARGMYVFSGINVPTLTLYIDFGFTSGKFNGSSIAVFSRNTVMEKERELAIVGGRGRFRMARGVAKLKTYYANLTNGDAIVEYNYMTNGLVYTVGVSDYRRDWFFAHVTRNVGNDTYEPTWQIIFNLKNVNRVGLYTLRIALASAADSELQVRINDPKSDHIFTTGLIGKDNAIARHGIHGLYRLYSIDVAGSLLSVGRW